MQKPVEKPIKFIKNLATKGKSYPITHASAVIDDNGESIKSTIDSLKNKSSITKVTWKELKDKRDAGKLIPGSLYRITDYNCITTQENTRSAGHQFDIVLLALSENKLAEEGWAMMNESNIYDVTFDDGVTRKCYIYQPNDEEIYVVDCETLLGQVETPQDIIIGGNNTASVADTSDQLISENLPYNYFQNSNLSAWKVWYCLDNDTARFAWVDDKIRLKINVNGDVYITTGRSSVSDMGEYLYWGQQYKDGGAAVYSKGTPKIGDSVYTWTGSPSSPTWITLGIVEEIEITNGRGVIYRLIDEFNNDVAYDFKNIQFVRKLTDGEYDADNGIDTWVYTFAAYNIDNNVCLDCSMINGRDNIVSETELCANNTIKAYIKQYIDATVKYELSNNSIVQPLSIVNEDIPSILNFFIDGRSYKNTIGHGTTVSLIECSQCSFNSFYVVTTYNAHGRSMNGEDGAILIDNKKVLTES